MQKFIDVAEATIKAVGKYWAGKSVGKPHCNPLGDDPANGWVSLVEWAEYWVAENGTGEDSYRRWCHVCESELRFATELWEAMEPKIREANPHIIIREFGQVTDWLEK